LGLVFLFLFREADCHGKYLYFWKAREDMRELQKTSSKELASSEAAEQSGKERA